MKSQLSASMRGAARSILQTHAARQRRRIQVPRVDSDRQLDAAADRSGNHRVGAPRRPSVFLLAPDYARPSGGLKVMYRHVDILNAGGIPAAAVHQQAGFRYSWFESSTTTLTAREVTLRPDDLMVFGEVDVDLIERLPAGQPFAILNQSGTLTWDKPIDVARVYEARPGLRGVITVSEEIAALLSMAFPAATLVPVRLSIDPTMFHPPTTKPPRVLSYMPRRGASDLSIVFELLRHDPLFAGWTCLPLEGMPQAEVAGALRRSSIFLTTSQREGFGLPAAEAMACGNVVVGYHGFGGREFFRPQFSVPVETGDVRALAGALSGLLRDEAARPGTLFERGAQAARWIGQRYAPQAEEQTVLAAYARLLGEAVAPR